MSAICTHAIERMSVAAGVRAMKLAFTPGATASLKERHGDQVMMRGELLGYSGYKQYTAKPGYPGTVHLFDALRRPIATADAAVVTPRRTAYTAALASQLLAPKAKVVTLLGAGNMSYWMLHAILSTLPEIQTVHLYNRTPEKAEKLHARLGTDPRVRVCSSADLAVHNADVVITLTRSETPLFREDAIVPGALIIASGVFCANAKPTFEVPQGLLKGAWLVAEDPHVLAEAEDVIQAGRSRPDATLAELVSGQKTIADAQGKTVVFRSVGTATQDLALLIALQEEVSLLRSQM